MLKPLKKFKLKKNLLFNMLKLNITKLYSQKNLLILLKKKEANGISLMMIIYALKLE